MRPAPLFGTLVVAGVGLIGGSVALGARQRFLAERVVGLDRDPAVLEAARGLGAIDEAQLTPGAWLADADLVVLATPGHALVPTGLAIQPYLRPGAVMTDVGSVKEPVVNGLRGPRGANGVRFVGGHPMAGSERGGVLNADASLLENAVWVLTPEAGAGASTRSGAGSDPGRTAAAAGRTGPDEPEGAHTDPDALARVRGFVEALGARPIEVSPQQHDRLVATVSHLPYLASVALTALVGEADERDLMMLLAAGGFRDLTRVASGDPLMSRDMVAGNREAVRAALHGYRAQLERLEDLLAEPDALLEAGENARRTRDAIPIVRRGLLPARFEVVIAVPDRPGELARITHALGEAQVNVKDIEVLGVRESGGAIRLAFATADEQERGAAALQKAGYEARGRNGAPAGGG